MDKESSDFIDAQWSGKKPKEWYPLTRVSCKFFSDILLALYVTFIVPFPSAILLFAVSRAIT